MKINFDSVSFGDKNIYYHDKTHNIKETLDDRNNLIRITKYDKLGRDVDCVELNEKKEIIGHLHKEYSHDGLIETYKNKTQEYVRELRTVIENNFTRCIEIFKSKTSPQNNYVNEYIRDISGRLVKIINNGKVINLK